MLRTVAAGIALALGALLASAGTSAAQEGASRHASYSCNELVKLKLEDAGRVIYYIAGHYDSKHDVWSDYGPNSRTETRASVEQYLPVEKIYTYCSSNPKETVVSAISRHSAPPARIVAGTLTCKGRGDIGLILGSQERLKCRYTPTKNLPDELYSATITKFGLEIGLQGKNTIVWTVLDSSQSHSPYFLAGDYAGVSADVAVGVGAGANILLGGSRKSVVLQPLSVDGEVGVNIGAGLTGLKIYPR